MSFIDHVLQRPTYGWANAEGDLIKPSKGQLVSEMISRMNVFKTKKNWSAAVGWFWVMCLVPFMVLFFVKFFTWWGLAAMFLYGMFAMSTHGTIWYHRYCTHQAYKFSNKFWRFFTQNLVIKLIPEEIYVVSHYVHHVKSDQPGDPYNAQGGFLYCFLADTNHQPISKDLNEHDYLRTTKFLAHTGIKINSYAQYQRWGSVMHPFATMLHWVLNWAFWFAAFYLIGGPSLACGMFGGAMLWIVAVRTFNYNGHGKGKDLRKDGVDFNRRDMSINQSRPGLLSGEWHNNHHLYPSSARAGFLPYQLDSAWMYIYLLYKLGAVSSYHDSKKQFYREYYDAGKLAMPSAVPEERGKKRRSTELASPVERT
jgi:sn-1 stearoyl-lipid 9-desaturase